MLYVFDVYSYNAVSEHHLGTGDVRTVRRSASFYFYDSENFAICYSSGTTEADRTVKWRRSTIVNTFVRT